MTCTVSQYTLIIRLQKLSFLYQIYSANIKFFPKYYNLLNIPNQAN